MNPRLIPTSRLARLTILRSQSDERLGHLVRHGSEAAFELIVHRYRRSLVGHCVRILNSGADAEEAVQDALVSAHAALVNGNEVRSLGPWLHAVAHNSALQILRRRVARAECPQEDCNGHSSVDSSHAVRAELREVVDAVQSLPPRQRDAIVMRELEGRSYAEIATRLGASDGAVRQLLNRARRSVRESVGALIPAEPLVRWLLSADDSSPAKGLLTLSGGSAVAIKLSTAAIVSAVSVVTLLPGMPRSLRPHASTSTPRVAAHRAPRSSAPGRLAGSERSVTVTRSAGTGGVRATAWTAGSAYVSLRSANLDTASSSATAGKPSTMRTGRTGDQPVLNGSGSRGVPQAEAGQRSAPTGGDHRGSMPAAQGTGTQSPAEGNPPTSSSTMFESPRMAPGQSQMPINGETPKQGTQPGGGSPGGS
jgi:RNA polymerase sigma factor (sigma-70 family)